MEVDNNEAVMQCFKIPSNIRGNLKISYDNKFTDYIVLWSKYQLFVYENFKLNKISIKVEPDFEVVHVIVINRALVCLDCSGNLNVIYLNSNRSMIKNIKISKQNIKCICACEIIDIWCVASLQHEQNRVTLWINELKMSSSPAVHKYVGLQLAMPNEDWVRPGDTSIIICSYIKSENSKIVKNIFEYVKPDSDYLLIIISFDNRNVYAVLFPVRNVHSDAHVIAPDACLKLYKSHTDIIDIKVTKMDDIYNISVGLSGGNIVKVPLLCKNQKPEVFHLNTTINNFVTMENTILYTDALTMWKNENAFSESNSTFKQYKVRNVRDFCVIGNKIICVTFSNLIYSFDVNHRSAFLTLPETDHSCAVQLVTNSDYLQKIIKTVEENEELVKKINKESEYLMALSLSERKDVMEELIQVTASVFDDYRDLSSKHCDLTLTDRLDAYYDFQSYYFLINVLVNRVHHKLNKLLSDVLDDIKIHITLFEQGVLKTTSIQIKEQLRTKNFVIPLKRRHRNIKRMKIDLKIITNIPGKYDENQTQWTVLYQKYIYLNAENFINIKTSTNNTLLKDDEDTMDVFIYKMSAHLYPEYKFHMSNCPKYKWTFFVKLPDCNLGLKNILGLINPDDSKKACDSFKHLVKVAEGNCLEFQVGKDNVKLNVADEKLVVTCPDIMVGSDIRNFFSRIIFNAYKDKIGEKFIDHKYYTTIENLKRNINDCISERQSTEEFTTFLTQFLSTLYCLIPI